MHSNESWPAPAKLNLFLHITGRRPDGYHTLQTVFQFLDFGDELSFQPRDDGRIERIGDVPGVAAERDLSVRAARLLREAAGGNHGVTIEIRKRLPMGGGVGGGSSDAATTLVALNALWNIGLGADELARLGLRLGADVPVFVRGRAAWAEGVGDELQPLPDLPEPWYLVIVPNCHVPTAEIFSVPELTRDQPPIKIRNFLAGEARNVCEPVVRQRYPEVDEALKWLGQFGPARMSGTGACIFLAFDSQEKARAVYNGRPSKWGGFVARGQNESPLRRRLESALRER